MSNEQRARDIYLNWIGVPKPNDSYPVGSVAKKLIDSFVQALSEKDAIIKKREAAIAELREALETIQGLCNGSRSVVDQTIYSVANLQLERLKEQA